MEPIDILIFSFNRATQLELCIRSIMERFLVKKNICVQYRTSNDFYGDGYNKLMDSCPNINFFHEKNFREQLIKILESFKNKYLLFLTDDDVFLKTIYIKEMKKIIDIYENNDQIHSISFRMNPKINYCYPAKKEMAIPQFIHKESDYLLWDWGKCDQSTCWGYPMSIDSHLYNRKEIYDIIKTQDFVDVNSLEDRINNNRFNKPLLISFPETKVFNVQNNFVQGPRINESVDSSTVEELNKKFMDNQIINTDNIYNHNPLMAHGALDYKFIKKDEYDEYDDFIKKYPNVVFNDYPDKRNKKYIIYLLESYNIKPQNYNVENLKQYKAVITWNNKFYEKYKNELNIYLIDGFSLFNRDYFGYLNEYISFNSKINGISLICKERQSVLNYDISKERLKVLLEIKKLKKIETHYYGTIPYEDDCYCGLIGKFGTNETFPSSIEKLKKLNQYKFNLCFENCCHEFWGWDYITEKIFDCFRAKTIPIYWGCYNIEDHIPKDLFIDFRDFKNDIPKLIDYFLSIDEKDYNKKVEAALAFEKDCVYGKVKNLEEIIHKIMDEL